MAKFGKESNEWALFQEAWKLFNEFADIKLTDNDGWTMLISKADEVCKKHGNEKFPRDLMMAIVMEIERRCKQ